MHCISVFDSQKEHYVYPAGIWIAQKNVRRDATAGIFPNCISGKLKFRRLIDQTEKKRSVYFAIRRTAERG
jgi:hypothetical protein